MKKKIILSLLFALVVLFGFLLLVIVPFANGVMNDEKNINKFVEDTVLIFDITDMNQNDKINDSLELTHLILKSRYKDSSYNLDSLALIWIEGDLGLDKDDLIRITKETRKKFRKTNAKKSWKKIIKKDIWETLEGGIATYYFNEDTIEKIHVRNFGETFQNVKEFYIDSKGIYFAFEIEYRYNRPMDYDSAMMIENNDNQVWDFDESVIIETRSYFKNGKLIRQISNQDCGAPNSQELRDDEQERLMNWHSKLINTLSNEEDLSPH